MKVLENLEQGTMEWHAHRRCSVTGTKLQYVMGTDVAQRGLIAELIAEKGTEQSKAFKITAEMERGTAEEEFAIKLFEKKTGKKVDQLGMCIHDDMEWVKLSPDGMIKNSKGKYTEAVEVKSPDSKNVILYKIENMIPLAETGLEKAYLKSEMIEVLEAEGIDHDPKMKVDELQALLPEGNTGKPSDTAPFLGIPQKYKWQVVHYFIVNEDLEKLHFVAYDERFISADQKIYTVEVTRDMPEMKKAIEDATSQLEAFREKWQRWEDIVLPADF